MSTVKGFRVGNENMLYYDPNIAKEFSTSKNYSAGEYVINPDDGKLYVFTVDHTAGDWTGTDARAAAMAEEVSDLQSAVDSETAGYVTNFTELQESDGDWRVGSLTATEGWQFDTNNRIAMLFNVNRDDNIFGFSANDGYEFAIYAWKRTGKYIGVLTSDYTFKAQKNVSIWIKNYIFEHDYNYKVVLRNADDPSAAMSLDEKSNLLYVRRLTDKTLSLPYVAADAKKTGEIKAITDDIVHTEKTLTTTSKLYVAASPITGRSRLNQNSVPVSYLFEPSEDTVYEISCTTKGARFRIGGVNSLDVSNHPVGEVLYFNDAGTKAVINSKKWKYILVQCATSSSPDMPTVKIKAYLNGNIEGPISTSDYFVRTNVAEYFDTWDSLFVTNGGASAKYGLNNVCYKETIATVHGLPLNAYMFSFATKRMLNGASYDLVDKAPGEIAFGDYMEYGTKRKIMMTSGMHGNEKATPSSLMQWFYNLCYNPAYKKYQCFDYYVIPICNPTGYNADTRNNSDGVNINRDAIAKNSLEAQAITAFISKQTYEMYFDFHQTQSVWDSAGIPFYGFVSQANDTESDIRETVNQYISKAIAETDFALNRNFEKTDNPQGGFLWEGSPESESPGTFRNFGHNYAPISCTYESSRRCTYYSNGDMSTYNTPAMECNQTFFDNVMAQMMKLLGA